jgi:MFS family permease
LFKNIQFAALCYTFATVIGLFFTLSSIMTELLQDNYDEAQCGLLGGIINLAAGVGALPVGPLLDRYKWFKSSLVTGAVTFFATFAIFLFGNKPDNMVLLSIASGLVGTTASAVIAIGFEMAIETTFPIPEEYGGTMLMVAANLHSLITLIFFSLQPQVSVSVYLFLALAGSAVVSAILLPRKYRRIAYESRVDVSKGDDDPRVSVLGNGTKQSDRQATEESQLLLHVN